jgi:hypothetical protein
MTRILNSAVAVLSPSETLTAVLSGSPSTTNPHYAAWWQDSSNPLVNQPVGQLNGATVVTIVASPSNSTQRIVTSVRIFNADSAAVTVTIAKTSGGSSYTLAKVALDAGDHLIFDDHGMIVLNSSGQAESVVA